jgi:hypothetical protein
MPEITFNFNINVKCDPAILDFLKTLQQRIKPAEPEEKLEMRDLTPKESAGYNKSLVELAKRQEQEEIINCSKCGKQDLTPDDFYQMEETITLNDRFKAVLCYKCFKEEVDMLSEKQDRESQIGKFTSKESQDNCFEELEENRKFMVMQ